MKLQTQIELVYQEYPRKLGKTPGMRTAKRLIKTDQDLSLLGIAVENYKTHIKINKIEPKFIMYWSTFMNQWEDWLDQSTGSVTIESESKWDRLKKRG